MRILTIHNKYRQRGGEDESREAEDTLLEARGHGVRSLAFDNHSIRPSNAALIGIQATWSNRSYREVRNAIQSFKPDVCDVHNFFPVASPSIYYAARDLGVPVVQTLHNYRLLCPGAAFLREGRICEDCLERRVPWPGVLHACYRGSRAASLAVATMLAVHNAASTWSRQVAQYVALTEFCKAKFVQGGLPADRVTVKQNFVATDLGMGGGRGDYILYVGRLSAEKGIPELLRAWAGVRRPGRLVIVGDGPLEQMVRDAAESCRTIEYLGRKPLGHVYELMGEAVALAFPSIWYEGMPRVIIESFCRGTPVIAHKLGSMSEMVDHQRSGWLVEPGNARDLAATIEAVFEYPQVLGPMRIAARREFENKYTADLNYRLLIDLYERVLSAKEARDPSAEAGMEVKV